jgi:hypothetical protein
MMKTVLIVLLVSVGISPKAQLYVDGSNMNTDSTVKYIEVVHQAPPSFIFNIDYIDIGRKNPGNSKFTDANGKRLKINSPMHLLNFMNVNGWSLMRKDISPVSSGAMVYLIFERSH